MHHYRLSTKFKSLTSQVPFSKDRLKHCGVWGIFRKLILKGLFLTKDYTGKCGPDWIFFAPLFSSRFHTCRNFVHLSQYPCIWLFKFTTSVIWRSWTWRHCFSENITKIINNTQKKLKSWLISRLTEIEMKVQLDRKRVLQLFWEFQEELSFFGG